LASKVHVIQGYVRKNEIIHTLNSLQDKVKGPNNAIPIPIYVTPILDTEATDKAVI
jgi:hypothetical protein